MKKLVHVLLTLGVLIGLGWTLWIGAHRQQVRLGAETDDAPGVEPGGASAAAVPEAFVVTLDPERAEALDLASAVSEPVALNPQRRGFGRVLDSAPLVALHGELAALEAMLTASRAEHERTQMLLAAGANTSRKAAEAAEAQFLTDETKLETLRRTAVMGWGAVLGSLDPGARRLFVDRLTGGTTALLRVDLLGGESMDGLPTTARVMIPGRDAQPILTSFIFPAADVDPKTQAQGFILRIEETPFPLRPGMAVTAWMELGDAPRAGFAVPRSAILRHDGRTWVYVREGEDRFVRTAVTLDSPLDGDRGWFVDAGAGGLKADARLIVTGAASLLSEELRAQGGGEAD